MKKRLNFLKRNFIKISIGGEVIEIVEKTAFQFLSAIEIWNETNINFFFQEFGIGIDATELITREKKEGDIVKEIFTLHGIENNEQTGFEAIEKEEDKLQLFFDGVKNILKVASSSWGMSPFEISEKYTLQQIREFLKPPKQASTLAGKKGYRKWTDEWGDVHEVCEE